MHPSTPPVHSRPSSRNAVASPSTEAKAEKLAVKAAANVASGVAGKKASASKKAAKAQQPVEPTKSNAKPANTPGLISLTKPMSEEIQASKQSTGASKSKKAKEAKFAAVTSSPIPTGSSRSKKSKASPKADASEMLLSKSAPSAPLAHVQQPAQRKLDDGNNVGQASGLTWQQEMFKNAGKSNDGSSRRQNKKSNQHSSNAAASKHDGNLAHPQNVQDGRDSPALTWQQELLGAKKRTGPHFDVFADARDHETFGDDEASLHSQVQVQGKAGKRRPRTGSFGSGGQKSGKGAGKGRNNDLPLRIDDLFESAKAEAANKPKASQAPRSNNGAAGHAAHLHAQYPAHGAPIHIAPSTPVKKPANGNQQHPAVAAIAYAGPNFHNSPSPASLPAPKFHSRLGKNSSELERGSMRPSSLATGSSGDSSSSDDEVELPRGVRGTTAPAEMNSTPSKAPAPTHVPSTGLAVSASQVPPKPSMQPGATVESLLARMLGGAKLN